MSGSLWIHRPGATLLHRLDPSAKIVALALWFTVALLISRPSSLAILGASLLAAFAAFRLIDVARRFAPFLVVLFVVSAILWAIFSGDQAGLIKGVKIGARLVLLMAMGLLVLATTRVEEIAAGLRRLGLPHAVAFALTLAFRLVPLFLGSARAIADAQACRGLDPRAGSLPERLRRHVPLLVPLVLSGLRSAGALAAALEGRGLGMHPRRTSVLPGRFGLAEAASVIVPAAALAGLAWLRFSGRVL